MFFLLCPETLKMYLLEKRSRTVVAAMRKVVKNQLQNLN